MQKLGAYLENVSAEVLIIRIGYLVRLILIYNKNIVIVNVIYLSTDQKALAAGNTEKDLTAIVDMYIGIRIALLRIVDAEACVVAGVGDGERAAFKYAFHIHPRKKGYNLRFSPLTDLLYHTMVRIATFILKIDCFFANFYVKI